jgi:hypothetical protein
MLKTESKKPKAAILLSGLLRFDEGCLMSIKRRLVYLLGLNYDVHIYLHGWVTEEEPAANLDRIKRILPIERSEIEQLKVEWFATPFHTLNKWPEHARCRQASQWRSVRKAFEMIDDNSCELVVRCRTDLVILDDIFWEPPLEKTVYVPEVEGHADFRFDQGRVINDQFGFGSLDVMRHYCCGLDQLSAEEMQQIEAIARTNCGEDSLPTLEELLKAYLIDRCGFSPHLFKMSYSLQRLWADSLEWRLMKTRLAKHGGLRALPLRLQKFIQTVLTYSADSPKS